MSEEMKLVEVIRAQVMRGRGTPDDPHRTIVQFWSVDGELLAEDDRLKPRNAYVPATLEVLRHGKERALTVDEIRDGICPLCNKHLGEHDVVICYGIEGMKVGAKVERSGDWQTRLLCERSSRGE